MQTNVPGLEEKKDPEQEPWWNHRGFWKGLAMIAIRNQLPKGLCAHLIRTPRKSKDHSL